MPNPYLYVLRGVPGSGKSTWAIGIHREDQENFARVNRDDIRYALFGSYWGPTVDENVVTDVENQMVESALRAGRNVLLDATNLNNKNLKTKLSLASRYGAGVEYVDFPVSLAVALSRNASRERQVPERAIKDMFKRYKIDPERGQLKPAPTPLPIFARYEPDTGKPPAYIVDTDGTVANHEPHRGPYDTTKYALDTVHWHVANVVNALAEDYTIIALSGRSGAFRDVTEAWWRSNNIVFDHFFMRPAGDERMDALVKNELFTEHVAPYFNVLGAFDDRPQVFRMWESIGVPVFAVGPREEF